MGGPEDDTENDEKIKRTEDFSYEKNQNVRPLNDHGSGAVTVSEILCDFVGESLLRIIEQVGNSFPVLKICCSDHSIDQEIFHVPVDKSDDLLGFFFGGTVHFRRFSHDSQLVVVVEDGKVGGLVD